jgi:23S rRNA (uracil1939-C5)-methyltransferase
MVNMAGKGERADVVFMDPPRAGSDKRFINSLATLSPSRIVYISCNPETLARDLEMITKKGYRVEKIQPVEMFPFTEHVETVVLLSGTTP